jgi:hypothetical protein
LKIKKYITFRLLVKLGLFLVLLGGAGLFDHYHQQDRFSATHSKPVESGSKTGLISFVCTTTSTLSVKAPFQKMMHSRLFREKLNLLLAGQMSARTFYTLKAEALKQPHTRLIFRNLLSFRYHFLYHPDDQPPVC